MLQIHLMLHMCTGYKPDVLHMPAPLIWGEEALFWISNIVLCTFWSCLSQLKMTWKLKDNKPNHPSVFFALVVLLAEPNLHPVGFNSLSCEKATAWLFPEFLNIWDTFTNCTRTSQSTTEQTDKSAQQTEKRSLVTFSRGDDESLTRLSFSW